MGSPATRHMFGNLSYQKSLPEIKEAMTKKVSEVREKIKEREARVVRIREEFGITDAAMIDLLSQAAREAVSNRTLTMSYSTHGNEGQQMVVQAGVVQNLLTEKSLIEQERESVTQLERILRNLRPLTHFAANGESYTQDSFKFSEDELEYLGF